MVDLAVLIPVSGPVSVTWASNLRSLEIPGRWVIHFVRGYPIDVARNALVYEALREGAEWIFFLDSDIVLPREALKVLLSWRLPIVSCLYWSKRQTPRFPRGCYAAWLSVSPERPLLPEDLGDLPRLVPVEAVGMGCCLIHRSVFEELRRRGVERFFEWRLEPYNPSSGHSEDIEFCLRVRELLGLEIYVDTGVRALHIFGCGGAAARVDGGVVQVM